MMTWKIRKTISGLDAPPVGVGGDEGGGARPLDLGVLHVHRLDVDLRQVVRLQEGGKAHQVEDALHAGLEGVEVQAVG